MRGTQGAGATLRLVDGPHAQERQSPHDQGAGVALPIHYEAEFETTDGIQIHRYLTDKGRAAMLRRLDEGTRTFSADEIEEMTVPADDDALLERTEREGGEGG
jgi:hypothetical protein